MELKDYTTEQLRAELKRRSEQKKKDDQKKLRCRNCVHCITHKSVPNFYICEARTWGKAYVRNYCVKSHTAACDKFENKHTNL